MTVMFCDLVGLAALTAELDPEDMADLLRASQGAIAASVARFDGHVAKWVGDGATIYFGYPRAHEDDAERAVRAGLALLDAVAALGREHAVQLAVRIGVSSGLVVVGELIGEGEARERGVVGDTANLAARLRSLTEPGTILVSETTRRLLGERFELKALGPQAVKGFRSPVTAWLVLREQEIVSRFDAARTEALTPFVGRDAEIALLIERWRRAVNGEGQVVLISGEPGIGKSRILATLRERIASERHIVMRYQCSPHHINDAFYPVIGQIWQAGGLRQRRARRYQARQAGEDGRSNGIGVRRDCTRLGCPARHPDRQPLSPARHAAARAKGANPDFDDHDDNRDRKSRRRS